MKTFSYKNDPELSATVLDIVFTPQINTWNGTADIQLKMRDMAVQPNGDTIGIVSPTS